MYDQKIVNISDLQVPSHTKQINITYKSQPFLGVFLSLCIVNHSFIELIFIVLGKKPFQAIIIHSFIQAAWFSMQAESSMVDAAPASLIRVTMNICRHYG